MTKGAGSRAAGLAMAFKLMLAAERSWRKLNGHHLLPLVQAAVIFRDGVRVAGEKTKTAQSPLKKGRIKKNDTEERNAA